MFFHYISVFLADIPWLQSTSLSGASVSIAPGKVTGLRFRWAVADGWWAGGAERSRRLLQPSVPQPDRLRQIHLSGSQIPNQRQIRNGTTRVMAMVRGKP
jgi:hypothetical protein